MRKLLGVVIVLVILAAGGHWYLWSKNAQATKQWVEKNLQAANAMGQVVGQKDLITYESLDVSGWPMRATVTAHKLKLAVPFDEIFKTMKTQADAGSIATPAPAAASGTQWKELIEIDWISVSTNMFVNSISYEASPDSHGSSVINGQERSSRTAHSAKPLTCTATFTGQASPGDWYNASVLFASPNLAERFRTADCSVNGLIMTDAKTNAQLLSINDYVFHVATDVPSAAQRSFALHWLMNGYNITKDFDQVALLYRPLINELLGKPALAGAPFQFSELGNMNFELDGSYLGPVDLGGVLGQKDFTFDFHINRFNIDTALFKSNLEWHITSAPEGDKRNSHLVLKTGTQVTERYDQINAEELKRFIKESVAELKPTDTDELAKMAKNLKPEELDQAVNDLYPALHTFGTLGFAFDGSFKGDNNLMAPWANGEGTIAAFDFLTTPFGIKQQGQVTIAGDMPKKGNATITCVSCEALLNRLFGYIKLIDKWTAKAQPEHHQILLPDALADSLRSFLKTIAAPSKDNAADWIFAFLMVENGQPTLNGKGLMEVMGAFNQMVLPNMPQDKSGMPNTEGAIPPEGEGSHFEPEATAPATASPEATEDGDDEDSKEDEGEEGEKLEQPTHAAPKPTHAAPQ